jgi:hypothetical protein
MSSVVISGDTSGAITVSAPLVAGTNTLTLQAATATSSVNTLSTAVTTTSGTAIDFTSLPNWIKRITVLFQGTSLSATADYIVQIGSGSLSTSGYQSWGTFQGSSNVVGNRNSTAGFIAPASTAAYISYGTMTLVLVSNNTWISSACLGINNNSGTGFSSTAGGVSPVLAGALDRLRITTTSTDTFDLGSVNILYEG